MIVAKDSHFGPYVLESRTPEDTQNIKNAIKRSLPAEVDIPWTHGDPGGRAQKLMSRCRVVWLTDPGRGDPAAQNGRTATYLKKGADSRS